MRVARTVHRCRGKQASPVRPQLSHIDAHRHRPLSQIVKSFAVASGPIRVRFALGCSFIKRVCYDRQYMLISLNGTLCHYCEIDPGNAPSMGRFYNARVKGHFD
jgi:hypothetical protein